MATEGILVQAKSVAFATLFALPSISLAVDLTAIQREQIAIERQAAAWELTPEQWRRYLKHMQGEGRYHSQDHDPVMALGIASDDPSERIALAQLWAQQEHNRLLREIEFARLAQQAAEAIRGRGKMFDVDQTGLSRWTEAAPVVFQQGDAIHLFSALDCVGCDAFYRRIAGQARAANASIHVYLLDDPDKEGIINWAMKADVSPADTIAGLVSLNPDNGRFAETELSDQNVPVALHVRGEQVLRVIE